MTELRVRRIANLMRNDSFRDLPMREAVARHMPSDAIRRAGSTLECHASWHRTDLGSLVFRYTTSAWQLTEPIPLAHRYSFPLRGEVRESAVVLDPERPEASSELRLAPEDIRAKGYFAIAIHDARRDLLSCDTFTFDRHGRVEPYMPVIPQKFASPLQLARSSLHEAHDARGGRVLRVSLGLEALTEDTLIKVGYNSLAGQILETHVVEPASPMIVSDLSLTSNPRLLPGELIVGVTDADDRMLINGILWLEADRRGTA